jgi:hypothetical protein
MELKAKDPIPQTYLDWFKADLRHAEEWRKEAQIDYDFRDGRQWSDTDKAILEDQERPPIVFNRVGAIIDAVSGQEISNRQEVRYIPRVSGSAKKPGEQPPPMGGPPGPMPPPEMAGAPPGMPPQMGGGGGMAPPPMEDTGGDQESTDLLTSASMWFRDQADADDNDSEAFRDTITGGMGWTETRLDFEDNPDGELKDDRKDPFEMVWDYNARKNNLIDATRLWNVKCLPIEEARAFAASMGVEGIEDDDLHAAWAANAVWDGKSEAHVSEAVRDRMAGRRAASGELQEAVIVHCQWIERVDMWRVPIPGPDGKLIPTDLLAEDYEAFKAKGKEAGVEIDAEAEKAIGIRKRKQKVHYQAFLGNIVLKAMPCACSGLPDEENPTASRGHFNFKCITAKRDQTKGQFYGLVRSMRDPQSWSNKLYSQILHIINSQAKGGILAERGAFDNDHDAQESWARTDRITWVKNGKLSGANPAWAQKPVAQVPPALQYLMDVAQTGIHQVSGVNMELLGMREADQAGVLEYQRRQAGLTILQPIFDNLKAYRREQGELILWYIQNDLSDGRLVRILGKEEGKYLPLAKQASLEYDIVVDDMPSSPNQKEKNWQLITQMMPFIKDMMTPEVALALAEDSPLPAATVQKLQKLQEQASQSPAAQLAERMGKLEADVLETKAALQAAQAEKAKADAQKAMMEQPVDPQAELSVKEAEATGKLQLKQQEIAANIEMKRAETQANIGLQREKQQGDFALRSQEAQQNAALQAQSAHQDMAIKERTTEADLARADKTTSADIALKDKQAKAAMNRPKPKPAGKK